MNYAKNNWDYQNPNLENKLDGIVGSDYTDLYIQDLTSCIGGKVYRDKLTGYAFTPANLADGVVRNGTWATANSDWKLITLKLLYTEWKPLILASGCTTDPVGSGRAEFKIVGDEIRLRGIIRFANTTTSVILFSKSANGIPVSIPIVFIPIIGSGTNGYLTSSPDNVQFNPIAAFTTAWIMFGTVC